MMRKRIVALLIVTALPLSLYGCGKGDTEPVTSENVEVETEEPTTEEESAESEKSEADTESESLESDESLSEDKAESESEPSAEDADSLTDAEIEAELEAIPDIEVDTTGREAESGYTGVVNGIDMDNDNNGQGWDKDGQHFNTWGEYCKYEDAILDQIFDGNPPEVEEFLDSLRNNNQ